MATNFARYCKARFGEISRRVQKQGGIRVDGRTRTCGFCHSNRRADASIIETQPSRSRITRPANNGRPDRGPIMRIINWHPRYPETFAQNAKPFARNNYAPRINAVTIKFVIICVRGLIDLLEDWKIFRTSILRIFCIQASKGHVHLLSCQKL